MMKKILSKFKALKTWQKVAVVITCIVLLPLAIIGVVFLLGRGNGNDITEGLIDQKKDDINERIEDAEKKDSLLATKEEVFKVEKKILLKEIEGNESKHAEIADRINNAKSIDELRAIARRLRRDHT
jgi:hypothetical protein